MFVQRAKRKLRELAYNFDVDGYIAPDLTILAEHVTKGGITEMAYQEEPLAIIWCVRDDGELVGLTYQREQQVVAWHRHIFGGVFGSGNAVCESVATIPTDNSEYQTYVIVKRTINSATKYYIEAFNDDNTTDSNVLLFGGTKPSTTTVTGLSHLEGKTVKVIVDDVMQSDKTVSSGQIILDSVPTTYVEIGIDFTPQIKTLPVELKLPSGNILAQKKRILEATANMYLTQNLTLNGNDFTFTAGSFYTGLKRRKPILGYDRRGQLTFSQSQPLFFTLLGIEYKVSVGQ